MLARSASPPVRSAHEIVADNCFVHAHHRAPSEIAGLSVSCRPKHRERATLVTGATTCRQKGVGERAARHGEAARPRGMAPAGLGWLAPAV